MVGQRVSVVPLSLLNSLRENSFVAVTDSQREDDTGVVRGDDMILDAAFSADFEVESVKKVLFPSKSLIQNTRLSVKKDGPKYVEVLTYNMRVTIIPPVPAQILHLLHSNFIKVELPDGSFDKSGINSGALLSSADIEESNSEQLYYWLQRRSPQPKADGTSSCGVALETAAPEGGGIVPTQEVASKVALPMDSHGSCLVPLSWKISKRYSSLVHLHDQLVLLTRTAYPGLLVPSLPPKSLGSLGTPDVARRAAGISW